MSAIDQLPAQPTPDAFSRWLAQAQEGSPRALGELLEPVRRYLLLIAEAEIDDELRVKQAASDAVQQTFMQAQRAIVEFAGKSEEEWRGWLRQILLNEIGQANRHYRAAKRRIGREVALADDSTSRNWHLAADEETPSAKASAAEELARLERALARLPKDYREIIERRNARQPFDEIGKAMGRSAKAAQMLWSRAVERLGQELK